MKTTPKLGLTLAAILGMAACGTTNTQTVRQPIAIVQEARAEARTPCDLVEKVDSYVGYEIMGGFPHSTFFAQAVGIENRDIEVVKTVDRNGEARYTSQGIMPAPYSVLIGPSKDKALRHLRNADIADGKEDHCITPEGIEVVMDAVRDRYAVTESEPVHIEIRSESYSRTGSNGSGSYHRSEVREGNKKPRVTEIHTGNLTVDEIISGNHKPGKAKKHTFGQNCNWDHNKELGSCEWDYNKGAGKCEWDATVRGKSQGWLQRCLETTKTVYDLCVGKADATYRKCQEE